MIRDQNLGSDELLVMEVVNGEVDAYGEIMARYEGKLRRYVLYLIHDQALAEDVVQDTFIKAYRNLKGFNTKYAFSSWIYRIAHNEAMNAVKRTRRILDLDVADLPSTAYDRGVEDLAEEGILKESVQGCLDELDIKYREVVQLVYFEHMKYTDVSDVLRIPASTVGVRLLRAKESLKKICEQRGVRR